MFDLISSAPASGFCSRMVDEASCTLTLTTLLGDLLGQAENNFGPRDNSFTILGIEFRGERPNVWMPDINRKHVVIALSDVARLDPERSVWQLAHEIVHLLRPGPAEIVSVAEEGFATEFQRSAAFAFGLKFAVGSAAYERAESLVQSLLAIVPDAGRRFFQAYPSQHDWTCEDMMRAMPGVPEDLCSRLAERFDTLEARLT